MIKVGSKSLPLREMSEEEEEEEKDKDNFSGEEGFIKALPDDVVIEDTLSEPAFAISLS